jgi:hypothetical protein
MPQFFGKVHTCAICGKPNSDTIDVALEIRGKDEHFWMHPKCIQNVIFTFKPTADGERIVYWKRRGQSQRGDDV